MSERTLFNSLMESIAQMKAAEAGLIPPLEVKYPQPRADEEDDEYEFVFEECDPDESEFEIIPIADGEMAAVFGDDLAGVLWRLGESNDGDA